MRQIVAAFALFVSLSLPGCDRDPVGPGGVVRVQFFGSPDTLTIGDSFELLVSAFKDDGTRVDTAVFVWTSSDSSVASVDQQGRITALRSGFTTVTAAVGPVRARLPLQVVPFANVTTCSGSGFQHTGSLTTATWRARHNPHWISGTVRGDSLVIEPGVVVCAAADAQLDVRVLRAHGTAGRPIRFLSADRVSKWRGILVSPRGDITSGGRFGHGQISYAFLELGNIGTALGATSSIRASHIRHGNVSVRAIHETTVDTGNVAMGGSSVFENTIVRGGSVRLAFSRNLYAGQGPITINGGRIEGSPGKALEIGSLFQPGFHDLNVANTLRIVGSHGGIGIMPAALFVKLWPTREAQANLLGNPNSLVELWGLGQGGSDVEHLYIRRELRLGPLGYFGRLGVGSITLERGSSITFIGDLFVNGPFTLVGDDTSRVELATTAEFCGQGNRVCGLVLRGNANSDLSYMTFTNAYLDVGAEHRVVATHIDVTHSRRSGVYVRSSSFRLTNCNIADNAENGIEVLSGTGVQIQDCNIERNVGFGVDNRATDVVNAQRNWWGDPAGPLGPAGDGVSSNVDYSNFRTIRR